MRYVASLLLSCSREGINQNLNHWISPMTPLLNGQWEGSRRAQVCWWNFQQPLQAKRWPICFGESLYITMQYGILLRRHESSNLCQVLKRVRGSITQPMLHECGQHNPLEVVRMVFMSTSLKAGKMTMTNLRRHSYKQSVFPGRLGESWWSPNRRRGEPGHPSKDVSVYLMNLFEEKRSLTTSQISSEPCDLQAWKLYLSSSIVQTMVLTICSAGNVQIFWFSFEVISKKLCFTSPQVPSEMGIPCSLLLSW